MVNEQEKQVQVPSLKEIQSERKRIRRGTYYRQAFRGTVSVLLVVAAIAVLITTLFLPILQISGDSMSPTMEHNEIVVLLKTKKFERGDLIGFYYQGKILLKRVIALPEDEVAIDADGNVYVNGELLDEPYVSSWSDFEGEFSVPEDCYFFAGDNRYGSLDARYWARPYIHKDDIKGKAKFVIFPFSSFGTLE